MTNKSYRHPNTIIRIFKALKYSIKGLKAAFKSESAFKQDLVVFILNTIAIFFLKEHMSIAWLFFCGLFLIFAELVNTAIEYIVDLVTSEHHELAGSAKDIGSALVLLAVINLFVSWVIILL